MTKNEKKTSEMQKRIKDNIYKAYADVLDVLCANGFNDLDVPYVLATMSGMTIRTLSEINGCSNVEAICNPVVEELLYQACAVAHPKKN
jgi:hypothetical protein